MGVKFSKKKKPISSKYVIKEEEKTQINSPPHRENLLPGDKNLVTDPLDSKVDPLYIFHADAKDFHEKLISQAKKVIAIEKKYILKERCLVKGADRRDPVSKHDLNIFPFSAIVRLEISFGNSNLYVGSGAFVHSMFVITAAHNVYDHVDGTWAKSVRIIPFPDGDHQPLGHAFAAQGYKFCECDLAVLVLDRPLNIKNWFEMKYISEKDRALVAVTGYPKKNIMLTHSGNILAYKSPCWFFYDVDTSPGQSGSPIYIKGNEGCFLVGVHCEADRVSGNPNRGVFLSKGRVEQINSWIKHFEETHSTTDLREKEKRVELEYKVIEEKIHLIKDLLNQQDDKETIEIELEAVKNLLMKHQKSYVGVLMEMIQPSEDTIVTHIAKCFENFEPSFITEDQMLSFERKQLQCHKILDDMEEKVEIIGLKIDEKYSALDRIREKKASPKEVELDEDQQDSEWIELVNDFQKEFVKKETIIAASLEAVMQSLQVAQLDSESNCFMIWKLKEQYAMNKIISRMVRTFKEIDGKAKPEKRCRDLVQTLRGDIQQEIEIDMLRYDEMLWRIKDLIRQKKENMAKERLKRVRYKRLILRKLMMFHQVSLKVECQLTLDYFGSNITQLFTNIISSDVDAQTGLSFFQDLYAELSDMSSRFYERIDEISAKAKDCFRALKESDAKALLERLKIQIKAFIKILELIFVLEKAKVQQEIHLTMSNIMNVFAYMIKLNQHTDIKLSSIKKFTHEYANISSSSQEAKSRFTYYINSFMNDNETFRLQARRVKPGFWVIGEEKVKDFFQIEFLATADVDLIMVEDYYPQMIYFHESRAEFFNKAKAKQKRAYTLLEGLLNKVDYDVHLPCSVNRGQLKP